MAAVNGKLETVRTMDNVAIANISDDILIRIALEVDL